MVLLPKIFLSNNSKSWFKVLLSGCGRKRALNCFSSFNCKKSANVTTCNFSLSGSWLKSALPVITIKKWICGRKPLLVNCCLNWSNFFSSINCLLRVIETGERPISLSFKYHLSWRQIIVPFQCFNSIISTLQWVTITKSNSPSLRSFTSAKRKPEYPFQGKIDFRDFNVSNPCPFTFLLFSEAWKACLIFSMASTSCWVKPPPQSCTSIIAITITLLAWLNTVILTCYRFSWYIRLI